jgi:hypothetical protein
MLDRFFSPVAPANSPDGLSRADKSANNAADPMPWEIWRLWTIAAHFPCAATNRARFTSELPPFP